MLKGILDPQDAREAVARGADAVVVSNHGGRQLDSVPSTITALPAIADAVGDRAEALVDGGIRSGLDVVKALALTGVTDVRDLDRSALVDDGEAR